MNGEYTSNEIFQWLKDYLHEELGFSKKSIIKYPKNLGPVRVPLYCKRKKGDRIVDEIVVDIYLSNVIIKSQVFPTIPDDNIPIVDAAPVTFYQYYFPKAKIFFAYPDYIRKDKEFERVKNICVNRGIGLLEVSRKGVKEKVTPNTLVNKFYNDLKNRKKKKKTIQDILEDYLENYVIYLVYYPAPEYRRRAIIRRSEEDKERISLILIDKLNELENIKYKDELLELYSKYRDAKEDDYDISEKCITDLWAKYLGLEYPEIQRRVENILQRNIEYREHFVHQFQVFLIGAYILDRIYPQIAHSFSEEHKCYIENVWLAASTFHDFSYGLQNFDTWLMKFFEETLRIKYNQTKENLNLLNLDAAMIREELYCGILKIVKQLKSSWDKDKRENLIRFFYEKTVRDRNHGVLSAISLLQLFKDSSEKKTKNK